MSATPDGLIDYQAQLGLQKLYERVTKLEANDYYRPTVATGSFSYPPTQTELNGVLGTPLSYNGNIVALVTDNVYNVKWLVFGDTVTWHIQRIGVADALAMGARVYNSANITVADLASEIMRYDTVTYDIGGFYDAGSPSRLTVPVGGTGIYNMKANIRWTPDVNGRREVHMRLNGVPLSLVTDIVHPVQLPAAVTAQNVSTDLFLQEGDYVQVVVHQNSGVSLDVQFTLLYAPSFSMTRVG